MNPYLLVFDQATASRKELVTVIDGIPEISNWMFFLDNGACIVSELSARDLTNIIKTQMPEAHFIIAPLDKESRGGRLRRSVWEFIQDPKPVSG